MERKNSPETGSNVWADTYRAVKDFSDNKKDIRNRSTPVHVEKIEGNDARYELREVIIRDKTRFIFTIDRKKIGSAASGTQIQPTLKNINWLAESEAEFTSLTFVLHEKGVSMHGQPVAEEKNAEVEGVDLELPDSEILAKVIEDLIISVIDKGHSLRS